LKLKFPSSLKKAIAAAPKKKPLKLKAQLSGGRSRRPMQACG
jgi:hypothetical protein